MYHLLKIIWLSTFSQPQCCHLIMGILIKGIRTPIALGRGESGVYEGGDPHPGGAWPPQKFEKIRLFFCFGRVFLQIWCFGPTGIPWPLHLKVRVAGPDTPLKIATNI